jgi:lipid A 3-O-deacylase
MRIALQTSKNALTTLLICFSLLGLTQRASAEGKLALGIGHFDFLDDEDSLEIRAEYRFDHRLAYGIKPFIGIQTTTDKAFHGLAGLYRDIPLNEKIDLTPSLGAGIYTNGHGPDLNHFIQFRSMIELGYQLNEYYKLSIGISHTSNAGLGEGNSGAESAGFYIHRGWP